MVNKITKGPWDSYLDYIKNTGGNPSVEQFDDDFEPIGPLVRSDMEQAELIRINEGKISAIAKDDSRA